MNNIFICGENKCDCDADGKPMLILGGFSTVEDTPKNREILSVGSGRFNQ